MRSLWTIILALIGISAHADSVAVINGLIARGNHAYDLSQRSHIKECADSASVLLANADISANDSIDLLASIHKLYGNYHYENATLDSAEFYYNKAGNLIASHPEVSFKSLTKLLVLRDKAQLYYRLANYGLAAELMAMADDEIEYQAPYPVGSDNWLITKLTYAICLARINDFDQAISIAETELANATDRTSLSYAKAQRMYAKILMLAHADKVGALKAYKSYFEKQKSEAMANLARMDSKQRNQYWQTLRPFVADCYQLQETDPGFLYDVTLFAKGLLLQVSRSSANDPASETALRTLSYSWSDIQKRLKPKQAAIEFIQYEKDGKTHMAALVLKPVGRPTYVHLTPPDQILAVAGKAMQSTDRGNKDNLYLDTNIHGLVWTDDLLKSIAGSKRIYFAPDGYLHRLAIEYMPPVAGLELYRLTSTRRLMQSHTTLSPTAPTLFVGGINYDVDKAPGNMVNNDKSAYANYVGKSFPRLSSTSNEAASIYQSRSMSADSLLVAAVASEHRFTNLAPNYASILVSTHGDFCATCPISTDIKTTVEDESMSQNIIALAGVNTYLQDKNFNADIHHDGLLSAKEISQLNLSACRLFTISACQSALGHISADGVFGLQRGLKNAGVETMLLSLWNVNSDATAMLMQAFYQHLGRGLSLHKAFALARQELIDQQPETEATQTTYIFDPQTMAYQPIKTNAKPTYNTPQYVNAFVLIDAIE